MNSISLHTWLAKATPDQREELARMAGSSPAYLYQIGTGRRNASAEKAAAIEAATLDINVRIPAMPPVLRTSSCTACATCPFAIKPITDTK